MKVVPIRCRIEDAFEAYRVARIACDANPTFENGERARQAWKEYVRAGMSEDERRWLDGECLRSVVPFRRRGA